MERPLQVLCVNAGSSSLKLALHAVSEGSSALRLEAAAEGLGAGEGAGRLWLRRAGGERCEGEARGMAAPEALEPLLALWAEACAGGGDLPRVDEVEAVGHRVVHGGPRHGGPRRVDAALLDELRALVPLAPLHLPDALRSLETARERLAGVPHVACFDTAFHQRLPEAAKRLPIPESLHREGVRRYGFHGLSFEHAVATLGADLGRRTVIAHLGSGSSLVALRDGRPVDTTMGFTPAGGVLMATRSGDLDPGVLVHLMREKGFDAERLERLVNRESGLRALSGRTGDMRALLAARDGDPRAAAAVEAFALSVRRAVASLAGVLGGLDLLVFTGAIGERSRDVRAAIRADLGFLGVSPEGSPDGSCPVRVVESDENRVIARQTRGVLLGAGSCA